ncbi:DUF4760 domain-containing protein [Albimonas donghaensis]|uniref:DUF4760 domain-containing protein n=1 Tax=Albimonas donghaensis TaxID=356660 RepID=UPI00115F9D0D|nr:DUF4760 domain-containing protein [Albimonas donghaensis]
MEDNQISIFAAEFGAFVREHSLELDLGIRSLQLLVGIGIVSSAWIAYQTFQASRNEFRAARIAAKKEKTLEYSLTRNRRYQEAREFLEKTYESAFRDNSPLNYGQIQSNEQAYLSAKYLLSHWEVMAISLENEIIDNDTAYEMVGLTFYKTVGMLRHFIEEMQRNNDRRYTTLMKLYATWEDDLRKQGAVPPRDQIRREQY